jgi:phospholipase C
MSVRSGPRRRDVLGGLGALGAVSVAGLPGCGVEPNEEAPPTDPKLAIEHIIVLMMENRTFDHYFGSLSLVEGRGDVDGLRPEHANPDASGEMVGVHHLTEPCLQDPPHGWDSSHDQFAEGALDGFVLEHQGGMTDASANVMGYYTRADLPVYYAMADAYALCDRWFASVMGPTWPNRIYSLTGTSEGMDNNDRSRIPFTHRSIFGQLDEAGIEWAVYFTDAPFALLLAEVGGLNNDRLRPLEDLFSDMEQGRLPQVVFIEPGYTLNDDHPPHPPMLGQLLVGTVFAALAQSSYWDKSMFIVDYDEHGGFFDHVVPPTSADDHARQGFDQLGFRVPALVTGPYAKAACVHTVYDHTSVLATIQDRFGLERLTARNAAAAPLWDCLDLDRMAARQPRAPITLPVLDVSEDDYGEGCFYATAHPGQEELFAAFDAGELDARFDRRAQVPAILARLLAKAEKLGVARIRPVSGR